MHEKELAREWGEKMRRRKETQFCESIESYTLCEEEILVSTC